MYNICKTCIQAQLNPAFLYTFVRIIFTFLFLCVCFNICTFIEDFSAMCTLPVCPVEGSKAKFDDQYQINLLILSVDVFGLTGG